jgi:hypothetical protein
MTKIMRESRSTEWWSRGSPNIRLLGSLLISLVAVLFLSYEVAFRLPTSAEISLGVPGDLVSFLINSKNLSETSYSAEEVRYSAIPLSSGEVFVDVGRFMKDSMFHWVECDMSESQCTVWLVGEHDSGRLYSYATSSEVLFTPTVISPSFYDLTEFEFNGVGFSASGGRDVVFSTIGMVGVIVLIAVASFLLSSFLLSLVWHALWYVVGLIDPLFK